MTFRSFTKTSLLAVPFIFSGFVCAQNSTRQSSQALPAEILGPPLIAWSQSQKPRPVPQPLPPSDQDDQGQQQTQNPDSLMQPAAPVFIGTIVKSTNMYGLKGADGAIYQIDDQERAQAYEARKVRISGSLDSKTNLLHVTKIELIS
jgi:hypothetical protein